MSRVLLLVRAIRPITRAVYNERLSGKIYKVLGTRSITSSSSSSSSAAESGVPYNAYKSDDDLTSSSTSLFPREADVVIIGGGVIGCSTLYHLARRGITKTVLLERNQLTSGTTWHTAGLVWSLRPNDLEVDLLRRSQTLMKRLEEETGVNTGWIQNGGLFIASTKERLDEYKRLMTLGRAFNIESHVLSPEETTRLYPLLNVKDVYGTLYSPGDGTIDPAGYCTALTRAATRLGATVVQQTPVTGIDVFTDDFGVKRVKAVYTSRGAIKTNKVVNCAGVWSRYVGAMAGVKVPLLAMKHAYVVTQKIEGIDGMPNVRDHDSSVYLKLQGDALSVGGYEPNPIFLDHVEKEASFSLFDLDWDVFGYNISGAINRLPVIERTGIKSTVCGPADHKPLMGESPEVRGFYLGCGFNSSGMMLSAGCGEELAEWVVDGRPKRDMYSYDIRRFAEQLSSNEKWLRERSHESYAKNYSIVFPHDEPLAGRNQRKDVLHQLMLDAGCVFEERHGWERPGWFHINQPPSPPLDYDYYGSYGHKMNADNRYYDRLKMDYTFDFPHHFNTIKSECMACRERVAVFNMSYFGKFYLHGPDSRLAADWIFSNNVNMKPGSTVYTCMLNERGGVEADLTVSVLEGGEVAEAGDVCDLQHGGYYIAIGGAIIQHGYSYIKNIIEDKRFNCKLTDRSEEMAMLSVQGPKSRELLQGLVDVDLSDANFPFSTHKIVHIGGKYKARAIRLSFVGELGWELHIPNCSARAVYVAIMEAGKKFGLVNAGYRAIDSLSIEKGYRHWHADLRSEDTPLEAGLGFTCKLKTTIPFIGRQALTSQQTQGLKKRIACFTINESVPLHGLETILRDGKAVGFLRRADYAHTLQKSIGYGYVSDPGGNTVTAKSLLTGHYELEHMGKVIPAQIHVQSPFDPLNKRVQGIYS